MMPTVLRAAYLLHKAWSWLARPIELGVRMILVQDGKVLLVRHTYMEGWHFPGGSMKRGETPLEAAAREAREEAGAALLEPPELVGIFSSFNGGKSDHVATYLCRKFRLERATDRWEIAERKLFALDALPPQLGDKARKTLRDLKLGKG
ncbi:MAG: NUDIX domain-containing protein [Caldilineaceae bacterium]|nr:NUDIX domain-containing protein [Caldilineaceae bacterium]